MHRLITNVAAITRHRRRFEAGQGLGEYALILALVAVLAIGATSYLGGQINGTLSTVGDRLQGSVAGGIRGSRTSANVAANVAADAAAHAATDVTPTPTPPTAYSTKKTCLAAGYAWITKPKPAHCA